MAFNQNYLYSGPGNSQELSESCAISDQNLKYANYNNLCMLASTLGKLAADLKLAPDSFEEFFEKLKIFEKEWVTTQNKYQKLLVDSDRLKHL